MKFVYTVKTLSVKQLLKTGQAGFKLDVMFQDQ